MSPLNRFIPLRGKPYSAPHFNIEDMLSQDARIEAFQQYQQRGLTAPPEQYQQRGLTAPQAASPDPYFDQPNIYNPRMSNREAWEMERAGLFVPPSSAPRGRTAPQQPSGPPGGFASGKFISKAAVKALADKLGIPESEALSRVKQGGFWIR